MFEQFSDYPEVKWTVAPAAKSLGRGEKIPINPDAKNFTLVKFRDLRKQPICKNKIMLVGDNETNIFIEGPDERLDAIIKRLHSCISKSWIEINKMSLEKDFLNCMNFETSACNPQLFDVIEFKSLKPGEETHELDFVKADEICANCEKFEPK